MKSCHFGYFMEYGLLAKERKKAGFEAPEVGTFLHYLLENVNRDVKALGGYGQVSDDALRRMTKDYVSRYAAERIDDFAHKSARFRYLFTRLRETAYTIILNIAREMRLADMAMEWPYRERTASGDRRPRVMCRARSMAESAGAYRGLWAK